MSLQDFNRSLFFSLQQQDFQTAKQALEQGANPNAIF
jgi:hypothetical protein